MITVPLNVLKFLLWLEYGLSVNVPWAFEKKIYVLLLLDRVLNKLVKSCWLIILFRSSISLMSFWSSNSFSC